ncbi:S1/P1 Nuclease [Aquisphaera giovannonii]|uniref:S1/P1 Nuclease n=1 Tax=Aquisphaera giovannonii TaxID=406548 RepID=A0A5B9WC70_9BACT|nr:S1/P1 nuclease [Aquisphaera giovannonii]QEH37480.1 S1/P1 Nuclease [Aquisphaera giovannonii]
MNRARWSPALVLAAAVLACPPGALAWNPKGHRVVATIAYRQLDEPTRQKVAAILRQHPAYRKLWLDRATNGKDEVLNLFWNAATFPDDARQDPWKTYGVSKAHYVNYRILAEQGNKVEPPLKDVNIIDSYEEHLARIRDAGVGDEDRAVDLSWVFHQAGDIHMPLHAVARFSKALPEGDRGGNAVKIPNPRSTNDRFNNLHGYWDDLLGSDEDAGLATQLADELVAGHPPAEFADALKKTTIRDWAEESVQLALSTVYNGLDPEMPNVAAAPDGYDAAAERLARRQVALAGYRLAEELKRLFPGP